MNNRASPEDGFENVRHIIFGLRKMKGVKDKRIEGIIRRGINKRLTKKDRELLRNLPE